MQENVNKFSNIKERIVYFVENQKIKKADFYTSIGMSSANFRGEAQKTPLNSTTIENIITLYPKLDLYWLITGKGEMLVSGKEYAIGNERLNFVANTNDNYLITLQKDLIESQKREIEELRNKLLEIEGKSTGS